MLYEFMQLLMLAHECTSQTESDNVQEQMRSQPCWHKPNVREYDRVQNHLKWSYRGPADI